MASESDVADELRGIEHGLAEAFIEQDRAFLERTLTEDWSVIDVTGRIMSRSQVFEEVFHSEDRQLDSGSVDEISVRLFGDWALVRGKSHVVGRYRGEAVELSLRFTDIFVRDGAEWKVVASQATPLHQST